MTQTTRARLGARLRRLLPWAIGVALIVVMATRVPFAAFRASLGHGPHAALALTNVVLGICVLLGDSIASWTGLIATGLRRGFREVLVARGATYLLIVLNYAVGQGSFGYYLYRTGVAPLRATGVALFLLGTNFATLIVVTTIAVAVHGPAGAGDAMWWTLLGCCGAYVLYLGVVIAAPGVFVRRQLLSPLFDAGLRGHLLAMLGRLPHFTVIVFGMWTAMRVWGIAVPLGVGLTTVPIVAIAASLPISPSGLGTTQAALVYFFGPYAAGATADDRAASVLAFSLVHFVYSVAASVVIGAICARYAKRVVVAGPAADPAALQ